MQQKEIEIKLLFNNKEEVISKLSLDKLSPEMKFERKLNIHDRYYSQGSSDMRNIHSLIRIREIQNSQAELTYKGKMKDKKNIWHRVELTTQIASPEIMDRILINLGFNRISEYKSEKEYWKFNGLEIIFAKFTIPAYLKFMEIEGTSEKKIRNIVKKLGNNVQEVGEEIFEVFDRKRKS